MILMKVYKKRNFSPLMMMAMFFLHQTVRAQSDSVKRQTIDITSSYKPVLRNISKINLTPTTLPGDTTSLKLSYSIPSMNLFYTYQPVALRPLALQIDSALPVGNRYLIKAGYGNFNTPVLRADIGIGDIKNTLLAASAAYTSSKGPIAFQDFHNLNTNFSGTYFTPKNEWYGGILYNNDQYYQYGFDHTLHNYDKDSVSRNYNDVSLSLGGNNAPDLSNTFTYQPALNINYFKVKNGASENRIILDVPLKVKASEQIYYSLDLKEDYSNSTYLIANNNQSANNIFQVKASADYKNDNFYLHGGLTPTFENGNVHILPEAEFITRIQANTLFRLGITSNISKNTLRTLTKYNPFINDPSFLNNTKTTEIYAGVKSTLGHHLDLNVTAGFIKYNNLALYINDTLKDKGFNVVYEPKLNDVSLKIEIKYYSQEKFSIISAFDINTYSGLKENKNAWGLIPVSFKTEALWLGLPGITLKGSLNYLADIPFVIKGNVEKKQSPATDIGLGADYKLNKGLSIFLELNNLLNNKYQRWNTFPVYGLQVLGGIKYQF